tara:strand:+ start:2448 stop:3515 length:1068 start_codon:yes stop_codon:yes gene_type:complete
MHKIIISTGGTGGHVIPAQILYDYLSDKNEVTITSDKRGVNYLDKKKYKAKQIYVPKKSQNLLTFIPFLFSFILSTIISYLFLKKKKINILISTGGYMSVPICLAAKFLNLKIFLFEPNLVLGRANQFLLNYCEKIFTYSKKIKNLPYNMNHKNFVIQPLIRKEIFFSKNKLKKKSKNLSLLIIGGSQSARKFDSLFNEDLIKLSRKIKIKIFHQTSKQNLKRLKQFYLQKNINFEVFYYSNNLHKIIKECDFVITRSGASTINELVFLETPFLAIPYPFAVDDHQFYNAKYYIEKNLGWLIRENEITENFLYKFIMNLIKNKKLLLQKKKNMHEFQKKYNWYYNSKKFKNLILK